MCIYIGIEDLVANALIELIEKNNTRKVFFSELDKYGAIVLKELNEKGDQAILIVSKERTTEFLRDYSEYFELFTEGINEGIMLKNEVDVSELWKKFRGCMPIKVMKAFMSENAIKVLGVSA